MSADLAYTALRQKEILNSIRKYIEKTDDKLTSMQAIIDEINDNYSLPKLQSTMNEYINEYYAEHKEEYYELFTDKLNAVINSSSNFAVSMATKATNVDGGVRYDSSLTSVNLNVLQNFIDTGTPFVAMYTLGYPVSLMVMSDMDYLDDSVTLYVTDANTSTQVGVTVTYNLYEGTLSYTLLDDVDYQPRFYTTNWVTARYIQIIVFPLNIYE